MSNPQNPIEHIVLLMLENRSFDHLLGNLHPQSPTFEGVNDRMCNVYEGTGETYYVSNNSSGDDPYVTPSAVPGEAFADINLQIFNATDPSSIAAPNMAGFVNDWMAGTVMKYPGIPVGKECLLPWSPPWPQLPRAKNLAPGDIMFYFNTSGPNPQLPVTSYLARSYGISDAWFGSCPTQTIANRMFLHCATSGGYVDNPSYFDKLFPLPFPKLPSIFELLDGGNGPNCANWKVYFHDYPVSGMVDYVFQASGLDIFRRTPSPPVVCSFDEHDFGHLTRRPTFAEDIRNRTLPKYSCIEPRYGVRFPTNPPHPNPASNSNHPPDNMLWGNSAGHRLQPAPQQRVLLAAHSADHYLRRARWLLRSRHPAGSRTARRHRTASSGLAGRVRSLRAASADHLCVALHAGGIEHPSTGLFVYPERRHFDYERSNAVRPHIDHPHHH